MSLAVAATAATALDAGLSPALAQCAGAPSSTVCTPGGNPYPGGINVDTADGLGGTPINLQLLSGVQVVIPSGAGGVNAVNAANTTGVTLGSANITITADGVTINNTANPFGNNQTGLRIQSSGDAVITATNTTIDVNGTASDFGILAFAMPNLTGTSHVASVTWSGSQLTTGTTGFGGGTESGGIQADNRGIGNATIAASGNITGTPGVGQSGFYGLIAHSGDSLLAPSGAGDASVTYNSGTINVFGNRPRGIVVWAEGDGSASVTTAPGTVISVNGSNNPGVDPPTQPVKAAIAVQTDSATAANGRSLTATVASTITNFGAAAPDTNIFNNPVGIRTISYVDAPTTVTYTGPGITTQGGGGAGIQALSSSGSITVNATGSINTTNGSNAVGILADSGTILALRSGLLTDTSTVHSPVPFAATTGFVEVNATNVSTMGQFGTAISATSGSGGVAVNIAPGGTIMGGWQADLASVGAIYGLQASGIFLSSTGGIATLTNNGSIGALSDRAVAGDPIIVNNGTVTGFVQLGGANDVTNNGLFNLRHFADTNGDGIRDTLRVAVSDLGSGPSAFTNNGTLALLGGAGATTLDATGQYLPLGLAFNSMALGGPVQGQILGATTFTNSGTIDLQVNPVPGDVLLISGGHTPGTTGGGTFIANGGRLLLDTVLNEGGANSRSDVLVVDGTAVGAGGATRLFAKNAGGGGALTVDNGILVVQSVDPSRSVGGVFALGAPTIAGAYEYTLFHGGVGSDATNGNWYLRSTLNCTLTPMLPECQTPIPPTPVTPNFRIETSLYAAIPSMALLYGRNLLDTLHDRVGEEFDGGPARSALASGYYNSSPPNATSQYLGWGRIFGMNGVQQGASEGVLGPGTGGPHFDYAFLGLQAGMDFFRQDRPDGSRDHAGGYFAIGTNQGQVTHFDGREGNSDFNAYSLGGYWTHFGPTGWYTDAILQGTFYDISSTANRGLPTFKTEAQGFAASLETGYPFKFAGGWFIEPQAQLIYQNININDASDIAAQIRFSDVDSLLGRIGARFGRTWAIDDGPRTITAWIRPNLWNEFRGNPTTSFSSETGFIPFHADLGGLWGEVNVGVSGQVRTNTTLYANASYQSRFDGGGFAYTGKAGLRVNW
ncbi:autotransporter outer membrane beta-barrel domain-containing protein [Bradyrhizobium lablabi]|uniref:autotransporter family protein n=1 Tax=Bradyrhizobium lablabi TaxID=722472 RepID=UPI001BADB1AE|nr:autotransporter outer membrane beta-barrel domain-containing protein [Bradyrhizobium lablabi]MBR0692323.1 autotransporter domain-containing protein [Bradyrhizobium lablabi]